eukprot:COSAG02_NODE_707_length_18254_cov_20.685872_1_plen_679_part_00
MSFDVRSTWQLDGVDAVEMYTSSCVTTASKCVSCIPGTYSTSSPGCSGTACNPGTYGTVGATSDQEAGCTDCAAGTYSATVGSEHCIDCGAGKYSAAAGSALEPDCIECGAGKYSAAVGSALESNCIDCGAGKYSAAVGSALESDCIECGAGKYSETVGNQDCIACLRGQIANATGSTTCVACPLNSGTQGVDSATACSCNTGFEDSAAGECVLSAASTWPTIVMHNLTHPSKVNPSTSLVVRASMLPADTSIDALLEWSLWQSTSSGLIPGPDLTAPGTLDSALDGENLVLRAGVLVPGQTYRVRLRASFGISEGSGSSAVIEQELSFSVNCAPMAGTVEVAPPHGNALNHTFAIRARGFFDDDTPLTYRFGYVKAGLQAYLGSRSLSSNASAMLPQGIATDFTYVVSVDVTDSYGASARSNSNVTVWPYRKPMEEPWDTAVAAILNSSNSTSWQAVAHLSSGVAAALNAFNGTNDATTNAELKQSRQLLVEALASTVINSERLDADAVDAVASTLEVITRNPAQLSTKSIEQSLELLVITTESSTDVPRLFDTQTATMIMHTSSNLLQAQSAQAQTSAGVPYEAPGALSKAQGVLASVAQSVAAQMVPNQNPVTIETPMFAMGITQMNTRSRAAADPLPDNIVQLPMAELTPTFQLQVISWAENLCGSLGEKIEVQ